MSTDHPVGSIKMYLAVFFALLTFTAITVAVSFLDLGFMNTTVALAIAVTKGTLVVLFFMGVRHNTPLIKIVAISGFLWLLILFTLGMSDYLSRSWQLW
jgi:cytochrome c oxidase subunit 4